MPNQNNAADCVVFPAGTTCTADFYCPQDSFDSLQYMTKPGTTLAALQANAGAAVDCTYGNYCEGNAAGVAACKDGTDSDFDGSGTDDGGVENALWAAAQCKTMGPGVYGAAKTAVAAGEYAEEGSTAAMLCPAGTENETPNAAENLDDCAVPTSG